LTSREIDEKDRIVKNQPNPATSTSTLLPASSLAVLFTILLVGAVLAVGVFKFGRQNQREAVSLRKEIETLNAGQVALRKDMGEMRDLLRRAPTAAATPAAEVMPRNLVLTVSDAQFKGNPNATLTLVEFTDYQCPFCARHVKETVPQLERDYIATGKLKYVFRNFPLESIHKLAFKAHEAATCAGEQGKFWEMHDRLFASQAALTPADILGYAQAVGLDMQRFQGCFNIGLHTDQIRKDIAEGQKAGVTATPAFFLGVTTPNSPTLKVVKAIKGAKAYSAFKEEIDALLAAPPSS
jgi:protein-disulfide isomerase